MSLRASGFGEVPKRNVNLKQQLLEVAELLGIDRLDAYLFGSRKDQTGSTRSDIDVLVVLDRHLKQEEAKAVWEHEPYLDVFVARNGVARSVVNESEVARSSNEELIEALGAAPLFLNGDWQVEADMFVDQIVLADRNPAASMAPCTTSTTPCRPSEPTSL